MRTESSASLRKPKSKGLGHQILNFSHNLAHGFGEKIVQPVINISQYRTFEHPERHRRKIDNQMYRIFQRAGSSVKKDNFMSKMLFAQFVLAAGLGEHVPIPMSWIPFIPHQLDNIPLPFDVHVDIPIPPADLLNHIPNVHIPTDLAVNGPYWPLLTSDIIMAGAVNVPNAIRAFREKRPAKAAWYTLSVPGAFLHIPLIFNSFWFELASRPAERKAGQVFAEKVTYVLEGSNIPPSVTLPEQPTSKVGKAIDHIPGIRRLREMSTGEIHIHPKDRHIFASSVQNRFTPTKSQAWWENHLQKVDKDVMTSTQYGIPHEQERITNHATKGNKEKKWPVRLWHWAWGKYHTHMDTRLDEKREAIQVTKDFIRLSQSESKAA